jgi:hypothetical protein
MKKGKHRQGRIIGCRRLRAVKAHESQSAPFVDHKPLVRDLKRATVAVCKNDRRFPVS